MWRFSVTALDLTGRETADYNRVRATKGNMRQRLAMSLVILMLTSMMSYGIVVNQNDGAEYYSKVNSETSQFIQASRDVFVNPNPWIEPSLWDRVYLGQEEIRVTVISHSLRELNAWQHKHGQIETQTAAFDGQQLVVTDSPDGVIDHRTFWLESDMFHKLSGVVGIIGILDAENSPEPYGTNPLSDGENQPTSVRSGEIHGATDAWDRGYSGEGIIVAVADTGIDFAHPDLDGTQARILDGNQHDGWPMMFDHNSMYYWLVNGEAYPERNTWYEIHRHSITTMIPMEYWITQATSFLASLIQLQAFITWVNTQIQL